MKVTLIEYPTEKDWLRCKERALITVGKDATVPPPLEWRENILAARHSPIRCLMFSFRIECPSWVATHIARHIHAQPYIQSQRNDRQDKYDRDAARQDAPVVLIWDTNAEELMTFMNKRLCFMAADKTREVAVLMKHEVNKYCPEFKHELVPMCVRNGGICYEMKPCGHIPKSTHWRDR